MVTLTLFLPVFQERANRTPIWTSEWQNEAVSTNTVLVIVLCNRIRHIYQKLQVVSGLCVRETGYCVTVRSPGLSTVCFHINLQSERATEQRRSLLRQSGTQGCFSRLCSYLTVCHCEHMKPDAIVTDSRNAARTLSRPFKCVSVWPRTSQLSSLGVFMCVCVWARCDLLWLWLYMFNITAFNVQSSLNPRIPAA